jgi:hypothetical protein
MPKSIDIMRCALTKSAAVFLCFLLPSLPAVAQSQFDPAGFIQSSETEKSGEKGITGFGIYRINGARFFQFVSKEGEVFLPAIGDRAEIREDVVVCRSHLPLKREALMIRDKLKPEAWVKEAESKIFPLILKCVDGAIEGPTVVIERPDGTTVQMQSKKKKSKEIETKVDRD